MLKTNCENCGAKIEQIQSVPFYVIKIDNRLYWSSTQYAVTRLEYAEKIATYEIAQRRVENLADHFSGEIFEILHVHERTQTKLVVSRMNRKRERTDD